MKIKDPWDDPRSRFEKKEKNGKESYSGQVWYNDIKFTFTLSEQSKGFYCYRGRVSARDPITGNVMHYEGKERKERQETSIVSDLRIVEVQGGEKEIKERILERVKGLYLNNKTPIRKRSLQAEERGESSLTHGVTRHGEMFANMGRGNKKTRRLKMYHLEKAALEFGKTPIKEIKVSKIQSLHQKGDITDQQINLLDAFWDYYTGNVMALPENPFAQYRAVKRVKKTGATVARERGTVTNMFEADEKKENKELLTEAVEDGRCLALILAKDAGLNSVQMSELRWGDVLFDEHEKDCVRICVVKIIAEEKRMFIRPSFYLCAQALRQRYAKLQEGTGEEDLESCYVVSQDEKTQMSSEEISAFVRERLLRKGIGYRQLAAVREETRLASAGIQFLLNTYRYKVETKCGLEERDPAAIKFLQSLSFGGDTTANFYHDYMSEEGQQKLYIAMRRCDSFLKNNSRRPSKESWPLNETETKTVTRISLDSVTSCLRGKVVVTLNPGETLRVEGKYGVKGVASVLPIGRKRGEETELEEISYSDLISTH